MKRIVSLSVVIVLISFNLYAGDLNVTGKIGVGTIVPDRRVHIINIGNTEFPNSTTLFGGAVSIIGQGGEPGLLLSTDLNSVGLQSGTEAAVGGMSFPYITASDYNNLRIGTQTSNKVVFRTANVDRMAIDTAGNVGIGTTNPQVNLDINGYNGGIFLRENGGQASLQYYDGANQKWNIYKTTDANDDLRFYGTSDVLTLQRNTGNVGIGTTSPGGKLDVNGDIILGSSSGNKQIYTWSSTDTNWRIGMSSTPGFTCSLSTSHVEYLTYANGVGQGFAVGVNGGNSSFEIQGSDHTAYFRGKVGIGTTNITSKLLTVGNTETGPEAIHGRGRTGVIGEGYSYDFYAMGHGIDYASASSIRWKKNITPIGNALAKVMALRGVHYDLDKEHGNKHDVGFIGEEVAKVLPEITVADPDDPDYVTGMDYSKMTPLLLEAIKEQQKQIEELKAAVEALKNKLKNKK